MLRHNVLVMQMERVYIGIGSNLGDKRANCMKAIELMDLAEGCRVKAKSRFYRTEPVGVQDQDWYLNGVISLDTSLLPGNLMGELLAIEKQLGRKREKKWDSRAIDLDILFFGQRIISEPDLEIPHPRLHLRRFVLVPLADLAPDFVHPVLGLKVKELLKQCPTEGQAVTLMEEF